MVEKGFIGFEMRFCQFKDNLSMDCETFWRCFFVFYDFFSSVTDKLISRVKGGYTKENVKDFISIVRTLSRLNSLGSLFSFHFLIFFLEKHRKAVLNANVPKILTRALSSKEIQEEENIIGILKVLRSFLKWKPLPEDFIERNFIQQLQSLLKKKQDSPDIVIAACSLLWELVDCGIDQDYDKNPVEVTLMHLLKKYGKKIEAVVIEILSSAWHMAHYLRKNRIIQCENV